jgi:hypothetical protein
MSDSQSDFSRPSYYFEELPLHLIVPTLFSQTLRGGEDVLNGTRNHPARLLILSKLKYAS